MELGGEATMSVTQSEKSVPSAAATTAGVEAEIRDLARTEGLPAGALSGESGADPGSDALMPLIAKIVAPSVAELERLIGQLQEARAYLQAEGERVQRETDHYLALSKTASESVKVISGAVAEWRKAGHPLQ
jgi:hypothetical protein